MDKLEKVINGLDCCVNHGKEIPRLGTFVCDFKNCTYEHYAGTPCYRILIKDALELLKMQEPKKVKNIIGTAVSAIGECPLCGVELNTSFLEGQRKTKFCYNCGQAVKWE